MPVQIKSEPPDRFQGNQPRFNQMLPLFNNRMVTGRPGVPGFPSFHPNQMNQRLPPPYRHPHVVQARPGVPALPPQSNDQGAAPSTQQSTQQSNNAKPAVERNENQIDSQSAKGVFGWTTIDEVSIPFLFRDEKKFISVRMVELKLLSKYPSSYPEELKDRPPLMSHYITANEAKLLNEINIDHCDYDYGRQPFTQSDLIVKLTDFEDFYSIVKKNFPEEVLKQINKTNPANAQGLSRNTVTGGWLQINNTVVPYVYKNNDKLVPLSVIKYAAGLLTDVQVESLRPAEDECSYLNNQCQKAGLNFVFGKTTKMITLKTVIKTCKPTVSELPKNDPFKYAQYRNTTEEEHSNANTSSSMLIPNTVSMQQQLNQQQRATDQRYSSNPSERSGPNSNITNHNIVNNNQMNGPNVSTAFPNHSPMMGDSRFASPHPPTSGANPLWMRPYMTMFPPHLANGLPPSMNSVPMQRMRMPPPYNIHQNNVQGQMASIPSPGGVYPRPELGLDGPLAATEGRGPPNRTMTMDMNVPLSNMSRRQSSESVGSNSSRPGSAIRMSPSRPHGSSPQTPSPSQPAPSASLGANPDRASMDLHARPGGPMSIPAVPGFRGFDPHALPPMFAGSHQFQAQTGISPLGLGMNSAVLQSMPQSQFQQSPSPHNQLAAAPPAGQRRLSSGASTPTAQSPAPLRQSPNINTNSNLKSSDKSTRHLNQVDRPLSAQEPTMPKEPSVLTGVQQPQTQQMSITNSQQASQLQPGTETRSHDKPLTDDTIAGLHTASQNSSSVNAQQSTIGNLSNNNNNKSPQQKDNVVPVTSAIEAGPHIKPVEFQGKTISCLTKEGTSFALVEAIARVYFSQCTLQEFQTVLESVLFVPVMTLTDEEERSFIQFYKLPTNSLMCNKVVKLTDFEEYLPQLKYMFKPKEPIADDASSPTGVSSNTISGHENRTGLKRPAMDTLPQQPQPKQMAGKLEDMISKLRQKTDGPDAASPGNNTSGAETLPDDDNVICLD